MAAIEGYPVTRDGLLAAIRNLDGQAKRALFLAGFDAPKLADLIAGALGDIAGPLVVADRPEDAGEMVTIPRHELDQLLAAATVYVDAFEPDEMMTLPGKLVLQEVEAVLEKYGKRY